MTESSASPAPPVRLGWGWRRSRPDPRDADFARSPRPATLRGLAPLTDLRDAFPYDPQDQGRIGSCTAYAWGALFEASRKRARRRMWHPSRLALYWMSREREGTVAVDAGCEMRTGGMVLLHRGAAPQSYWAYDDTPAGPDGAWPASAKPRRRPGAAVWAAAERYQGLRVSAVPNDLQSLRGTLAEGLPICFGFMVFSSLYDPRTGRPRGVVPMPNLARGGDRMLGGHAVVVCGHNDHPRHYDLKTRALLPPGHEPRPDDWVLPPGHFLIRNSWGTGEQFGGYFAFPYAYMARTDLAADHYALHETER